ncbi:HEPN domain-containing protein [Actinomadura nitritigenes]|uniref:ApeA N-terminal domain 1-containing protein n=1 Tax=Actinomadura nitritigenes TaxID=134602 RepID=UPI003D8CB18C
MDELGTFWLPNDPTDHLSGRLQYSPTGKIDLSLVGKFQNTNTETRDHNRIVGLAGKSQITLEDCFSRGVQHNSPGIVESRFRANRMFIGHTFGEDDELAFQTVRIQLSHLDEWVERHGIELEEPSDTGDHSWLFSFKYVQPEEESEEFSRGKISLGQFWSRRSDSKGASICQLPFLRIDYDDLVAFSDILRDVGRVQDIVTLCIDSPVDIDQIILTRPDIESRTLSGRATGSPQHIEFRAPRLRYEPVDQRRVITYGAMLLNSDEVGRVSGLAKWIDEVENFERPLNSLMSTRHTDKIYAENRYLNIAFAAEAFHRNTQGGSYMDREEFDELLASYMEITPEARKEWLKGRLGYGNDAPLPKRLRELARQARPATRKLITDERRWVNTISRVRNELTHLGRGKSPFTGSDLYYLSESIFSVVRVEMLSKCGVSTETWARKSESTAMTWHAKRVQQAIDSTRDRLGISRASNT